MSGWQPIETAPKDGTWIIGYTGSGNDLYIVMRWWDGYSPADEDDLSGEEEGAWIGGVDVYQPEKRVTHWKAFTPHPKAPPITTSMNHFDAANGTECVSREERGIPRNVIDAYQKFYSIIEACWDDPDIEGYPDPDQVWAEVSAEFGLQEGIT
jgi:hypothetical protein